MPWAQAREEARRLGARGGRSGGRAVALGDALGAVLARDLTALVGVPPYDAAAMDGYAVAGPGPEWAVTGRVLAGSADTVGRLRPGQAVEIATGAQVPDGTDAVLPYEHAATSSAGAERVRGEVVLGKHVRRAGEDTFAGDTVVPAGTPVTPALIGLAASLGHDSLLVRRPRMAALVTGDEVTASGRPGAGRVRDAIGPMLPGIAAWAGAEPVGAPRFLRDGLEPLAAALRAARDGAGEPPEPAPDVLAVCGASSKGPADHLRAALAEVGATIAVDGVACRPGHPQLLAHLGPAEDPGTVVVGLPGNPNAALAAATTLLIPALRAMAGGPDTDPALPPSMRVKGAVHPHAHDTRLVAVRVSGGQAEPVGHDRPGSLRGAALADAYAVIPPGWSGPHAALLWLPR
ncbi:molybdopterin molybdotransferase MoeA [Streptomonospora sp. PA3]|uniref:molybdopterin molybdotransferase MoeA n=1 Tax=Streptomonospora sp. PA3 TaxID=2607326 RepID=UPI002102DD9E|nr:molybdopterin molybdotransferase MoeA [Streptomonospora sp. PA3]